MSGTNAESTRHKNDFRKGWPGLKSAQEVADYVGVPVATVYRWNTNGTGPRRYRVGKHVRYRLSDVDTWLEGKVDGGDAA